MHHRLASMFGEASLFTYITNPDWNAACVRQARTELDGPSFNGGW